MASVLKRKTGKWQVLVRKKGYPLICKSFDNKKAATFYANSIETQIDSRTFEDQRINQNTTLKTLLIKYRDEVVPAYKSRETLTYKINRIIKNKVCQYSLSNLSTGHINEFKRSISEGRSPKTINGYIQTLHTVWNMAAKNWGYRMPANNPFKLVPLEKVKNERDITITDEQFSRLVEESSKIINYKFLPNMIKFAALTAARFQEILNLKKQDVDFINRTCIFRDTKNGEDRKIPLSYEALDILKKQRSFSDHFFIVSSSRAFRHMWTRLRVKAEIGNFRFHDLRSFAIRKMLLSGMQTIEVAQISGHKTLAVLHRRYSRLKAEDLVDKINNVVLLQNIG